MEGKYIFLKDETKLISVDKMIHGSNLEDEEEEFSGDCETFIGLFHDIPKLSNDPQFNMLIHDQPVSAKTYRLSDGDLLYDS